MPSVFYAIQPLQANRAVKLVGPLIDYAQPGDTVFGCTVTPSDFNTLATSILLDDEAPWLVEMQGAVAPGGRCNVGANGVAIANAFGTLGKALASGINGYAIRFMPAIGPSVPSGVPNIISVSRALDAGDDGLPLIAVGTPLITINTGLPPGFSCAIKGDFTYAGTATVTDGRLAGSVLPWCALMPNSAAPDTYDLVGGMT